MILHLPGCLAPYHLTCVNSITTYMTTSIIVLTESNSETIQDASDIACSFNEFFHSTFTNSDFVLPWMDHLPTPSDHMYSIDIDPSDNYNALENLTPLKAIGCDKLRHKFYNACTTSYRNLSPLSAVYVSTHLLFPRNEKCAKLFQFPNLVILIILPATDQFPSYVSYPKFKNR